MTTAAGRHTGATHPFTVMEASPAAVTGCAAPGRPADGTFRQRKARLGGDIPMDTTLLKAFIATAEALHVGRAAVRLGMAQSALSQKIIGLESRLGVKLFVRANRRITLTEEGQYFLEQAQKVIALLQVTVDKVRVIASGGAGELRIGYVGSVMFNRRLASAVVNYRDLYPNIFLAIQEGGAEQQMEWLRTGALDLAFLRAPVADLPPHVETMPIARSKLVAALPRSFPPDMPVTVENLSQFPVAFLDGPESQGLVHAIHEFFNRAELMPPGGLSATSAFGLLGLVNADLAVAVVPEMEVGLYIDTIRFAEIEGDTPSVDIVMAYRNLDISKNASHFIEMIKGDGACH